MYFLNKTLHVSDSSSVHHQEFFHCTHSNGMSYRFANPTSSRTKPVPTWSCSQAVSKPVWHIPLLCVQWKNPGDGQRNCPKHVEFYSKNKFEKLLYLAGFITRIYHAARSSERQIHAVPSWSCSQAVSKPVRHIPLLCVQWKSPDDGQRNCPKHVEFYSKNTFEKLVHLVGFIIRIYHDARSPEREINLESCYASPSYFAGPGFKYWTPVTMTCFSRFPSVPPNKCRDSCSD